MPRWQAVAGLSQFKLRDIITKTMPLDAPVLPGRLAYKLNDAEELTADLAAAIIEHVREVPEQPSRSPLSLAELAGKLGGYSGENSPVGGFSGDHSLRSLPSFPLSVELGGAVSATSLATSSRESLRFE